MYNQQTLPPFATHSVYEYLLVLIAE